MEHELKQDLAIIVEDLINEDKWRPEAPNKSPIRTYFKKLAAKPSPISVSRIASTHNLLASSNQFLSIAPSTRNMDGCEGTD
jgi:hypothetical protein